MNEKKKEEKEPQRKRVVDIGSKIRGQEALVHSIAGISLNLHKYTRVI